MQEPVPDLKFLEGQPGYVIIAVVLIGAAAWVITRLVKRSGDTGEGKEGLAAVDSAAEYLAERAIEERAGRKEAETDRDKALEDLQLARAELTDKIVEHERTGRALAECERRARDMARKAEREEERRRGEQD